MILSCHYRSPLVFEPALLDEAQARLDRFYNTLENLDRATAEYAATRPTGSWRIEIVQLLHLPTDQTARIPLLKAVERAKEQFEAAMDDDFNSAGALAALFDYLTSINQELAKRPKAEKASPSEMLGFGLAAVQLRRLMAVLGLRGSRGKGGGSAESEKLLDLLLQLRQAARRLRRFDLADQVRDQLKALGYEIEDLPNDKWAVKKH
jgi:cysteinyl-tRNA synthetase